MAAEVAVEIVTNDDKDEDTDSEEEIDIDSISDTMINIYFRIRETKDLSKAYIQEVGEFMDFYKNKNGTTYLCSKAIMYQYGIYYSRNIYEAIECYKKISGHSSFAMNALGDIYYDIFEEPEKALFYYSLSADSGDKDGMFGIALIYKNSDLFKNIDKSIYWYTQILEIEDDVRAMRSLYYIHKEQKNYTQAIEYLKMIQDLKNDCNECQNCTYRKKDIQKDIDECTKLMLNQKTLCTIYTDIRTDSCSICLNKLIGTTSPVLTLICGHSFHNKCVNCIKEPKTCPVCREDF